jgi:hypothetical protein
MTAKHGLYSRTRPEKREEWRQNACTGKQRHATIEEANWSLRALEMKGETGLNVYLCLWCWHYHVGHDKKGA